MTFKRDIGVKELLAVAALIGAIFGGIQGIRGVAASVSSNQIKEHTIVTEEKHSEQYNEFMQEQNIIKMDVAVTKERVKQIGDDVNEIKEMLRDGN